jgi:hypothetical protein
MNFLHDLLCDRENEHVAEPGNMMTGQHVLNGRVERMGAVARAIRQRSVSHPRSSNRTCPIKASGSPTGFTVRHTESKLTARGERVRVSIASPLTRPSPNGGRVGIRIVTFEACSGFTHVTARRIAQPPKASFVTRLQPFRLPGRAALVSYQINRQLSGWNLPPLMIRAFGAHCQHATSMISARLRKVGAADPSLC